MFVFLIFVSCGNTEYEVLITNNSDKIAVFTYNDITSTLTPSETKTFIVPPYTQAPSNIIDQNGIAGIKMIYDTKYGNYSFSSADYYNLSVTNEFPFDVTISAENYIDNNGQKYLTVNTGTNDSSAIIYTRNPKFISTLSYPIIINWSILDNNMQVNIK